MTNTNFLILDKKLYIYHGHYFIDAHGQIDLPNLSGLAKYYHQGMEKESFHFTSFFLLVLFRVNMEQKKVWNCQEERNN